MTMGFALPRDAGGALGTVDGEAPRAEAGLARLELAEGGTAGATEGDATEMSGAGG